MRVAIIQFPGATCIRETSSALARAGMTPVPFLWNDVLSDLCDFSGYIIPGGFTYEDRSRAGIIAALHPLMSILKEQTEQGKPLLGICNGAQILVESGLVPGLNEYQLALSLTTNKRPGTRDVFHTGFYHTWVNICLSEENTSSAFTRKLKVNQPIAIPIAHGEGRFVVSDTLWRIIKNDGCTSLHYCDVSGGLNKRFPVNPNGSAHNIAALSNANGNVLAMMPHPERCAEGDLIFQSMHDYMHNNSPVNLTLAIDLVSSTQSRAHATAEFKFKPIDYQQPLYSPTHYTCPKRHKELIIAPLTTDNHALTLQNTLLTHGYTVQIRRFTHWEIQCSPAILSLITQGSLLFNPYKEQGVNEQQDDTTLKGKAIALLIRAKEDLLGHQKKESIKQRLGSEALHQLNYGILWVLYCAQEAQAQLLHYVLRSGILFNPHAQTCQYYSCAKKEISDGVWPRIR